MQCRVVIAGQFNNKTHCHPRRFASRMTGVGRFLIDELAFQIPNNKMKLKLLSAFLLIISASQSFANNMTLSFDRSETRKDGLARNFRDLSQFNLNAIASAEFSENELMAIKKKFPNDKIIIVDLRRESHALINGKSASWEGEENNKKEISEILLDEKSKVDFIRKNPKNNQLTSLNPKITELKSIMTEEELVKKNGFEYKRFAILDRAIPDQNQFDAMVNFIKTLPEDKKLYIHCAAGKGRTTTFLVIYDIIKNGNKVSLSDIIKRQKEAGGAALDVVDEETSNRSEFVKKRLEMLTKLHDSVR